MAAVAAGGLVVNLIGLGVLHGGVHDSLNMRAAWLHVLSDALGSVAVLLAALCAWTFGWHWADPAISVVVAGLVLASSWSLLKESVAILMEAAPGHMDLDEVRRAILAVPRIQGVERLHVWTITSGVVALSAHVAVEGDRTWGEVLSQIRGVLRERFGVEHITIQLEPEDMMSGCCAPKGAPRLASTRDGRAPSLLGPLRA